MIKISITFARNMNRRFNITIRGYRHRGFYIDILDVLFRLFITGIYGL
jgi:hypothetical protein